MNAAVSALRFFFRVTLKRSAIVEYTHFIHEPRKLPVVLSPEEVVRLLSFRRHRAHCSHPPHPHLAGTNLDKPDRRASAETTLKAKANEDDDSLSRRDINP
jgi:hypothetical protein